MAGRHRHGTSSSRVVALAAALSVLIVGVGVAVSRSQIGKNTAAPADGPISAASAEPRIAPSTSTGVQSSSPPAPIYAVDPHSSPSRRTPASPPVLLEIPSIGVRSWLQAIGLLRDHSLRPPTKWQVAGWYSGGVVPGEIGPAVIAGHIDSKTGPAVFFRLNDLRVGAHVRVTQRSGHVLTFVVDGQQRYAKSRFPSSAVYGPTPDAELRLVTCSGTFDRAAHSYLDNLVVSAHLV